AVDNAGNHGAPIGLDHDVGRASGRGSMARPDSHDAVVVDLHPASRVDGAVVVAREDGGVDDGERRHGSQPANASTTAWMSSIIGNRIGHVTPASTYWATVSRQSWLVPTALRLRTTGSGGRTPALR